MIQLLKSFIEQTLGIRIFRNSMPRGSCLIHDLKNQTNYPSFKTLFDVGAHHGETAIKFAKAFPQSRVLSFEPISENYNTLKAKTQDLTNCETFHMGLGPETEEKKILLSKESTGHSFREDLKQESSGKKEVVFIKNGDEFLQNQKIDELDLLKIDTEGFDLEVLKGFSQNLKNGHIPFVLVESGFDDRFIPLDNFIQYLEPLGYKIFGIYDQTAYWWGKNFLWNTNVLFIHENAQ